MLNDNGTLTLVRGRFFSKQLFTKLGISKEALRRYAIAAELKQRPKKKGQKYCDDDIITLCLYIIKHVQSHETVTAAKALMAEIAAENNEGITAENEGLAGEIIEEFIQEEEFEEELIEE